MYNHKNVIQKKHWYRTSLWWTTPGSIMCWSKHDLKVASFIGYPIYVLCRALSQVKYVPLLLMLFSVVCTHHFIWHIMCLSGMEAPRTRPGWTPTTRLSFHYFVIWIQRPPMHAINPVPSHHLHHFVCKLSLVCPCYFLQKSCLITCRPIILSFGLLYLLPLSCISYFPDIFVWTNVVTEKQALVVSHVSSGVVQITKHCSKYE